MSRVSRAVSRPRNPAARAGRRRLLCSTLLVVLLAPQLACDTFVLACQGDREVDRVKREARQKLATLRREAAERQRRAPFAPPRRYADRRTSVAATPPWGALTEWQAPQLADAAKVFAAAEQHARTTPSVLTPESLLLCRVACRGSCNWDSRSLFETVVTLAQNVKADLRPTLSLAGETLAVGREASNGRPAYVSLPVASLRAGDALRLDVVDVDPVGSQDMGHVIVPVTAKLPLRFEHEHFGGRCVALGRAEIEAAVLPLFLAASDALQARAKKPPGAPRAIFDRASIDEPRRLLGAIAAWVGWADPRLKPLRERFQALVRRSLAYHQGAMSARLKAAHAAIEGPACGAAATRLLAKLEHPSRSTRRRRGRRRHGRGRRARRGARAATPTAATTCLFRLHVEAPAALAVDLSWAVLLTSRGEALDLHDRLRLVVRPPRGRRVVTGHDMLFEADARAGRQLDVSLGEPRLIYFPRLEARCPATRRQAMRPDPWACRGWVEWLRLPVAPSREGAR